MKPIKRKDLPGNHHLWMDHALTKPIHQINEEAEIFSEKLVGWILTILFVIAIIIGTLLLTGLGVLIYWAVR